jgi:hypothetical protein
MLGNRGASLTTESSAAFPSAEDASPDSPHSKPKHSGGTTFTPLKKDVSRPGVRASFKTSVIGLLIHPGPTCKRISVNLCSKDRFTHSGPVGQRRSL